MEQRFNNHIMEPLNPKPVAEYVTKGVVVENYYALVAATWGYETMKWPEPDYHQPNIAVAVIATSLAVLGRNSRPECGWKGPVLFDLSRCVGCSFADC